MNDHHLVLGQLQDFITGCMITDTHDERYRQKIARFLVNQRGYRKSEITPQFQLTVAAGEKCARVSVTFIITIVRRVAMIIHYGPGSLVTRHRPALAMSRLVASYQVPVVVVSNGEAVDILDGATGRVVADQWTGIPRRSELLSKVANQTWADIPPQRASREARIVFAYEVDDRCPCDDTTARLGGW